MKTNFLQFDSNQIKLAIYEALKADGRYTEYLYPESKLSVYVDTMAASFETLMFYLNNQAADSTFSNTSDIGKLLSIVKLINYHAKGMMPSSADVLVKPTSGSATTLLMLDNTTRFSMTIPKNAYYTTSNGTVWSPDKNYTLGETISADGTYIKFVAGRWYTASTQWTSNGTPFQNIQLTELTTSQVGWPYINVYVGNELWTLVYDESLETYSTLNDTGGKIVELILDEDYKYSLRFGDGTHGRIPATGSIITIDYLLSPGGASAYTGESSILNLFSSDLNFKSAAANSSDNAGLTNFNEAWSQMASLLTSYNPTRSTDGLNGESSAQVKSSAPASIAYGGRLARSLDYRNYLLSHYTDLLEDAKVQNNFEFASTFYSLLDDYGLLNWDVRKNGYKNLGVNDAGNVYIWTLTKNAGANTDYIAQEIAPRVVEGQNPVIMPGFEQNLQFGFIGTNTTIGGMTIPNMITHLSSGTNFRITIRLDKKFTGSLVVLKAKIIQTIRAYMSTYNRKFAAVVSTDDITSLLTSISGVTGVSMRYVPNTGTYVKVEGLKLISWNTNYLNGANISDSVSGLTCKDFMYFNFNDALDSMVEFE